MLTRDPSHSTFTPTGHCALLNLPRFSKWMLWHYLWSENCSLREVDPKPCFDPGVHLVSPPQVSSSLAGAPLLGYRAEGSLLSHGCMNHNYILLGVQPENFPLAEICKFEPWIILHRIKFFFFSIQVYKLFTGKNSASSTFALFKNDSNAVSSKTSWAQLAGKCQGSSRR